MKESSILSEVRKKLESGDIANAEKLLEEFQGEKDKSFWLISGEVLMKQQKWGPAINAFHKVLDADPDCKKAKTNIEIIENILNFWNPDMFNA